MRESSALASMQGAGSLVLMVDLTGLAGAGAEDRGEEVLHVLPLQLCRGQHYDYYQLEIEET